MAKTTKDILQRFRRANIVLGLTGHLCISLFLLALLLTIWSRSRTIDITRGSEKHDRALALLRGLQLNLHQRDGAARMQDVFPEGACFTWTLYGLTWSNLLKQHPDWPPELREEAYGEIEEALEGQLKPVTLAPFSNTQVRNGVFWLGQRNLLLARYHQVQPEKRQRGKYAEEFHQNSRELYTEILSRDTRHLDSYEDMCWPADSIAALTSLVVHDELFGTSYRPAYEAWKKWTVEHAWGKTQLPAGRIDGSSGQHIEPARGVANSWIIALVAEMDSKWAKQMYEEYREHFGIRRLSFRMFREYPPGHKAKADIDSGPIIWGAGVAATGVGIAAANAVGDRATLQDLYDLSRMFGFPTNFKHQNQRAEWHYFGIVPVGDAFLAYGLSVPTQPIPMPPVHKSTRFDRLSFHALMALLVAILTVQYAFVLKRGLRLLKGS